MYIYLSVGLVEAIVKEREVLGSLKSYDDGKRIERKSNERQDMSITVSNVSNKGEDTLKGYLELTEKECLDHWTNEDNYQTILDGYFIFDMGTGKYDEIPHLKERMEEFHSSGYYTILVSGSTSPEGEFRGTSRAGRGREYSDFDVCAIVPDDSPLLEEDGVHTEGSKMVNKLRSDIIRIGKNMTSEDGIMRDIIYSAANLGTVVQGMTEFTTKLSETYKCFNTGDSIEIPMRKCTVEMPPQALAHYYMNSTLVHDGLGMVDAIDALFHDLDKEEDMVEHRKESMDKRKRRLRTYHFQKVVERARDAAWEKVGLEVKNNDKQSNLKDFGLKYGDK